MAIPPDYVERVYAGVLGKIIGVYLGRPFEGWTYERITAELGEIDYYVHDRLGKPLVVTDDDISGTFTFLRALSDYANGYDITAQQIGQTWLNYLIEDRTVLWWGGLGVSTENTAFLRLKSGIPAPQSGSIAVNGQTVAEQIGAQIFIDGWGMVCPGDPERAAELARRAASVSHDGEAIYGAQTIAAIEACAFAEPEIDRLLDTALRFLPTDSLIRRMTDDLRDWHVAEPDWRRARERLARRYGYDSYGGGCHIIPNHGLILLSLLYGGGDFGRSLTIVNTCGWDTDCNSGNVGCILGIRNDLAGIDAGPDWRGPVADRMYLPTADGGRAVTDALTEAYRVANIGRSLAGLAALGPKGGARYHFSLPGSVQGFRAASGPGVAAGVTVENGARPDLPGERALAIHFGHVARGQPARAGTATFTPPEAARMPGYGMVASPALYAGQILRARVFCGEDVSGPARCRLYVRSYGPDDTPGIMHGPATEMHGGEPLDLRWQLPPARGTDGGAPIFEAGVEIQSDDRARGTLYLDSLTWEGTPDTVLRSSGVGGTMWLNAWANAVGHLLAHGEGGYRLIQNEGRGLAIQGTREWNGYRVSAAVTVQLARAAGIAANVQGLRRYHALLLCRDGMVRLVRVLDGETVLAEKPFAWRLNQPYPLALQVGEGRLRAWVEDRLLFDVREDSPLDGGAVALVCEEGSMTTGAVAVEAGVTDGDVSTAGLPQRK